MPVSELELFQDRARSDWVRLRTLVTLRWIAIAGQVAALFVASEIFRLQIEIGLVALAVGASVLANLFSTFLFPQSTRLTVTQATVMLLFDLLQLGLLLYLTGGLNNPFSILMLVPVTIAATFLPLRSTITVSLVRCVPAAQKMPARTFGWRLPALAGRFFDSANPPQAADRHRTAIWTRTTARPSGP